MYVTPYMRIGGTLERLQFREDGLMPGDLTVVDGILTIDTNVVSGLAFYVSEDGILEVE